MQQEYLDFQKAECRDCYKCLRGCPVKAIEFSTHQARIIPERCILCGRCTHICPQNAKRVHSERENVEALLREGNVYASVAPSFVSSFGVMDFTNMQISLGKLGFSECEETAIGAQMVSAEYEKLLKTGEFDNFITSACPAVNRLIQMYYPKALKYLAPVDSPMLAHAKKLKAEHPGCKVVFIGPCIAKKREARESGLVDGVLTFEELQQMFEERGISPAEVAAVRVAEPGPLNRARYYPISRGIIKSLSGFLEGYEYIAVDGVERCMEVLADIDNIHHAFLELNACEQACVNGPCKLDRREDSIRANAMVRQYVKKGSDLSCAAPLPAVEVSLVCNHPRLKSPSLPATDREIAEILARTGKVRPEDELNCGACGYSTCREKAWAVANGYADVEMCLPYMRERAETMSYEVMQNSPNGIVTVDFDLKIQQINPAAAKLWGIDDPQPSGRDLVDFVDPSEFMLAMNSDRGLHSKRVHLPKTDAYVELSIVVLKNHKMMFGFMKDITAKVRADRQFDDMKAETVATAAEVINKQMRVAQESASLLGETTAETKAALLKPNNTLEAEGTE